MKILGSILGVVVLATLGLAVAFARSAAAPPPAQSESAHRLEPGPRPVASMERRFVDESRPTRPNGDFEGAASRTLEATIWYPEGDEGPHPLVIYSHGFMSSRSENAELAALLASHGYVVAAVDYPLTNGLAPGGANISDVVNQPADVRFLIDRITGWAPEARPFEGEIDRERIALVGLSLGGLTTALTAYHPALRDSRVSVAVSIAGPTVMFTRAFFASANVPLLMIAGTGDAMIPYAENAAPILGKLNDGGLVTIADASHAGFANFADMFPLRLLANPDSIGCWALTHNLGAQPPNEAIFADIGGSEIGVEIDLDEALPCQNGVPEEALPAGRQLMVTRLATLAFLQSRFARDAGERAEYAAFLAETLARDFPEASYSPAGV